MSKQGYVITRTLVWFGDSYEFTGNNYFYGQRWTYSSKLAGKGKVSAKQIDTAIGQQISKDSVLCTDAARNYTYFARQKNLKHVCVNGSKKQYVVEKIYHIQNVNSYHSRLEDWINHIFGVLLQKT